MKTLNEQIAEIKMSKGSNSAKRKAFVELGLRPYEISLLMSELPKTEKKAVLTFGVEIECLVSRQNLMSAACSNDSFKFKYENYNHTDGKAHYKFVPDSSIQGRDGIECVSPVLKGSDGMKSLELCCQTLNEANAVVNRSTGLHVHIGAESFTDSQYVAIFKNYQKLEKVIDSFMAHSRRKSNNVYCKSICQFNFNNCNNWHDVYATMRDRYHKVNPVAYTSHKTIEFRQHQGSTDFKKISSWVKFLMKLCQWSKDNVLEQKVQTIDEIPFLTATEKKFFNSRREALA